MQLGCVSQDTEHPRKSIPRKVETWGSNRAVTEWVHRKELCKNVNHKNAIRVRQNLRTVHFRKPCNKNVAPAEKYRTWRKSVYTHFPKDRNCDICLKTKITRASCRRRVGTVVPRAEHFGDLITAGHKILSEESESRNNHRYAVVVQDLATQWLQSYPCKSKNFSGDPEEPNEVPGADKENQKSFTLTIP